MTGLLRRSALTMSLIFCAGAAFAQHPPAKPQAGQASPQPSSPPQLDGVALAIMIKSTVAAVQHANATGNYSVLRDLGSPIFRERYDQAKLTEIFASLRARGVNLSPTLLVNPNLTKQPEMTPQGQLHLVGNFPTQPLQIQYELLFLQLDGIWRLDGIAIDAVPSGTAQTSAAQQPDASKTKGSKLTR